MRVIVIDSFVMIFFLLLQMIPKKFVRIHGKNLNDEIFLNVPNGPVWSIKLKRHKNEVCLKNGWPEFAKFYSICFGYLLVFEYQGDSKFQVLIFHPSAVEIDYPLTNTTDNLNTVKSTRSKKRVVDSDDSTSVEVVRPSKRTTASSSRRQACHDQTKLQPEIGIVLSSSSWSSVLDAIRN